jgi:hypothetical protein
VIGVVAASTLNGDAFVANSQSVRAFHDALVICAALLVAGGLMAAIGIVNPRRQVQAQGCSGGQLVAAPKAAAGCEEEKRQSETELVAVDG